MDKQETFVVEAIREKERAETIAQIRKELRMAATPPHDQPQDYAQGWLGHLKQIEARLASL